MVKNDLPAGLIQSFARGGVIPAMPLALRADRSFDPRRQKVLIRYYLDAGVSGIAVGVHSTQFEIRDPDVGLFEPVLSLASEAVDEWCRRRGGGVLKIAGCTGPTPQAVAEAELAEELGFHACLASLRALNENSLDDLVAHCRAVSEVIPVIGFYLQPAVGGRVLPVEFWRRFAELDNVLGIKIAAFNRYQTFDVVRAVCEASRESDIILYTGNDDSIVADLLTEYRIETQGGTKRVRIKGGLLGQWGFWTRKAVELLQEIRSAVEGREGIPPRLLTIGAQITDVNAAVFDPLHGFRGCISGIHEILRRQGLFEGTWCINPAEALSPGQAEEISRVYASYPHLNDDEFVQSHLGEWIG